MESRSVIPAFIGSRGAAAVRQRAREAPGPQLASGVGLPFRERKNQVRLCMPSQEAQRREGETRKAVIDGETRSGRQGWHAGKRAGRQAGRQEQTPLLGGARSSYLTIPFLSLQPLSSSPSSTPCPLSLLLLIEYSSAH